MKKRSSHFFRRVSLCLAVFAFFLSSCLVFYVVTLSQPSIDVNQFHKKTVRKLSDLEKTVKDHVPKPILQLASQFYKEEAKDPKKRAILVTEDQATKREEEETIEVFEKIQKVEDLQDSKETTSSKGSKFQDIIKKRLSSFTFREQRKDEKKKREIEKEEKVVKEEEEDEVDEEEEVEVVVEENYEEEVVYEELEEQEEKEVKKKAKNIKTPLKTNEERKTNLQMEEQGIEGSEEVYEDTGYVFDHKFPQDENEDNPLAQQEEEQERLLELQEMQEINEENQVLSRGSFETFSSLDENIQVYLRTQSENCLEYSIVYHGSLVIDWSSFYVSNGKKLCELVFVKVSVTASENFWSPLYSEWSNVKDAYQEFTVMLESPRKFQMDIVFRIYNEGVGINWSFFHLLDPNSIGNEKDLVFALGANFGDKDGTIYQHTFGKDAISHHALQGTEERSILNRHPLTVGFDTGFSVSLTEARNLQFEPLRFSSLKSPSHLVGFFRKTAWKLEEITSPWFVWILGRNLAELAQNNVILLNLNPPPIVDMKFEKWVQAGKVMLDDVTTTQNSLSLVDRASRFNASFLLIQKSWEDFDSSTDPFFDSNERKKMINIQQISSYGKTKGVKIFLEVNPSLIQGGFNEFMEQITKWQIAGLYLHIEVDSSKDTTFIIKLARSCYQKKILLCVRGNYALAGLIRSLPNVICSEDGQGEVDMNAPITTYLSGMNSYNLIDKNHSPVYQAARVIVNYNPLRVLSKYYSDSYNRIQLLIPDTWAEKTILSFKPDEHICILRKSRDSRWFIGCLASAEAQIKQKLSFLSGSNSQFIASYYFDNDKTTLSEVTVSNQDELSVKLEKGKGFFAIFKVHEGEVIKMKASEETYVELAKVPIFNTTMSSSRIDKSKGYYFIKDPNQYEICSFENVCFDSQSMYIFLPDPDESDRVGNELSQCEDNPTNLICKCKYLPIRILKSRNELGETQKIRGITWFSGHSRERDSFDFLRSMTLFHAVSLHAKSYGFDDLENIVLSNYKSPLSEFQSLVFDLSTSKINSTKQIYYYEDIEDQVLCTKSLFLSSLSGQISPSKEDLTEFRKTINSHLDSKNLGYTLCPEVKPLIIMERENQIRNLNSLVSLLTVKYMLPKPEVIIQSSDSNLNEVDSLINFSQYNLVITTRGSHLLGTIIFHQTTALIEVSPTYLDASYANFAAEISLFYRFTLAESVFNEPEPKDKRIQLLKKCNSSYQDCRGTAGCMETSTSCSLKERQSLMDLDFSVDLNKLNLIVDDALNFCNQHNFV